MRIHFISISLLLALFQSYAQVTTTNTWTGASSAAWALAANWSLNSIPSAGTVQTVFKGDAANNRRSLDIAGTGRNVGGMRFDATAASGDGFTFTSSAATSAKLQIRPEGIVNNDSDAQTYNVPIQFFTYAGGSGSGASQTFNANAGNIVVSGSYNGNSTVATLNNNGGTLTVAGSFNTTIGSTGTGDLIGSGGLIKNGTGVLTLGGSVANTYSGVTTINAGTLVVNKANAAHSATGTGAVTVNSGATLTGAGTVSGSVTVNGVISPGASPGTLNTGSETWNGGGTYLWEINDVDAGVGANPGHDLLNITGGLTVGATSGNQFTLKITSLTLGGSAGTVNDFDNSTAYSWKIAATTTGVSGFDATKINLDTADFQNSLGGGAFSLSLANSDRDLMLGFTPVPEPAEMMIATTLGLCLLAFYRRRLSTRQPAGPVISL